jgi:outer membrane receptor for ferric coprogen and ferric-rhodotorulic acid
MNTHHTATFSLTPTAHACRIALVSALMGTLATPSFAQIAPADAAAPSATAAVTLAAPDAPELPTVVIMTKRANRVSKGATGLPMEVKETPQSISTIDKEDINDFGFTGSNDVLWLGTGINVEQYESNRASYNARGFDVQLTQIDGLGMSNAWGNVVGQQDAFLFEKVELIRGANGLLTGAGNASGTINYVRKRPFNKDGGEVQLTTGSYGQVRGALDYNKVLTDDGRWAGRLVVSKDDKGAHLRAVNTDRTSLYGAVDGQIGDNGVLTLGFTHQNAKQTSPLWGNLTLNRVDGSQAEFDASSSTSQDWTYWNAKSTSAFVEYTHLLSSSWEAKVTLNKSRTDEDTRLLYAYTSGGLNLDNTGLLGWPYSSKTVTDNDLLDVNINGVFNAFGREHSLIAGMSHSTQSNETGVFNVAPADMFLALPAFPYGGHVYPEPTWGALTPSTSGEQKLTRMYGATRWALADGVKAIVGFNAVKLDREGSSRYGSGVNATSYPSTRETSPYLGFTYDLSPNVLGYVSYSDIFQYQDQTDINGKFLDPMKGVNQEIGVKADWLDRRLLTTFAVFGAQQKGLATYAGLTSAGRYYYAPQTVKSRGFEAEASGKVGVDSKLTVGLTHLKLTGADGQSTFEWVPRTTFNVRYDTRVAALPQLKLGIAGRWQSAVGNTHGVKQDAYLTANAFASYAINNKTSLRLNVYNLFNKKYLSSLQYGAIYGAPLNGAFTLEYKL